MTTEFAPRHRRGYIGSFIPTAGPAGLLLATTATMAVAGMDKADFLSYGWRIPSCSQALLVLVGLAIRASARRARSSPSPAPATARPSSKSSATHTRTVLLGVGTGFGFYVVFYVLLVFAGSYLTTQLRLPAQVPLVAVAVGSVMVIIFGPLCGRLSDRFGRRPMIVTGSALSALFSFAFFAMLATGGTTLIYLAYALAFGLMTIMYSPLITFIAEQFPTTGALQRRLGRRADRRRARRRLSPR